MKASGFVPYSQSSYVVFWGRRFITHTAPGSVWPPGLSYLKVHGAREVNKLEEKMITGTHWLIISQKDTLAFEPP